MIGTKRDEDSGMDTPQRATDSNLYLRESTALILKNKDLPTDIAERPHYPKKHWNVLTENFPFHVSTGHSGGRMPSLARKPP